MTTFLKILFPMLVAGTLHAATPSFDQLALAGYKKTEQGAWVNKKNKSNVVTTAVLTDAWFDLSESEAPKYIQKQTEIRSTINFFAGISEWSVAKQSYKKDDGKVILSFEGEYKHAGQTYYFQEKQIFIAPNIYQIKMSSADHKEVSGEAPSKVFDSAMAVLR